VRQGEVHRFQKGKGNALLVTVGVWVKRKPRREGSELQIHLAGISGGLTFVTNPQGAARYHKTLFRDLRKLLIKQDCWPYGREGEETESRG